jgi:hypothetical protein
MNGRTRYLAVTPDEWQPFTAREAMHLRGAASSQHQPGDTRTELASHQDHENEEGLKP